ncbi:folate-binding protein [Pseudooceanicola sp. CBS1P-1]|uniref:Folate-binding protein n=1 Tax=Pseudooceanicola albus TaxID=2692189 RepID=A0A6L7G3N9_9RHOB|nr:MULTISPECIES: folate-binding protein YgfZ [Pseudooceanicola]MBT9385616.1 folate-binding protein [Pseudooceanicola endophyticus]MXN18974.1 folate-binding protein [Pseudooceanicola albus]
MNTDPEISRRVLRLTGADAHHFLQNLVTNNIDRLPEGPVYAALLTPQGKYLADFILLAEGDAILLDCAEALAAPLMQRLSMYKLRADVKIAETDLKVRRGTGPAPEGAVSDPRDPALGWRLYGPEGGDDGTDWAALRVAHAIPASGLELTPDTYILEAGFERLHGVDFRKGCYVGQEVTARMKHKTELKKGLVRVTIEGSAEPGTPILSGDKPAGQLYTQAGGAALAHLRFDRMQDELSAGTARIRALPQ